MEESSKNRQGGSGRNRTRKDRRKRPATNPEAGTVEKKEPGDGEEKARRQERPVFLRGSAAAEVCPRCGSYASRYRTRRGYGVSEEVMEERQCKGCGRYWMVRDRRV
jgi:DNA-directed RNA polymerase subunit M/transcription elongation factor TFIIS